MLEIARRYVSQGLSVIPVKTNGSKSPLLYNWRKKTTAITTEEEMQKWFGGEDKVGIGIVPGPASQNLIIVDFECKNGSAYTEFINRLPEDLKQQVMTWWTVSTPSGGKHLYLRLDYSQPGAKLAMYKSGTTKIELRGEGHQVLAPGCPPECHKDGKEYTFFIEGDIPQISQELFLKIIHYCSECSEYTAPEQTRDFMLTGSPASEGTPGNDFNVRASWYDTGLFDAGWSWAGRDQERGYLTRPGKNKGVSASIGMITSRERGYPYFYCWSTSVPDFATETPYSKFAVYAILKHGGDYKEAAKELRRLGYGDPDYKHVTVEHEDGNTDISGIMYQLAKHKKPDGSEPTEADLRWFKWASELSSTEDETQWLWEGYIPRGQVVLFSALWKSGKTTAISHLLKAFEGSTDEFLGQKISPSRVLVVTEEDETIWSNRRDELLINDHVGFKIRPFSHKPTIIDWRAFCATVADVVQKHQFDLVILDTLSKLWPVKDENSATDVEEALQEIWKITSRGASVFLVHHTRKSGGTEFIGSRGSGGLPAFADVIIEFGRMDATVDQSDRRRRIKAIGRWSGIPEQKIIELTENNKYVEIDDVARHQKDEGHEWHTVILDIVRDPDNNGMDIREIQSQLRDILGAGKRDIMIRAVLKKLADQGEIVVISGNGRGNKTLYASPEADLSEFENDV